MIRVLLADDQEMVRTGFRMILEATGEIEVVAEAADGPTALERARHLRPDVCLLDIRMPGLDGDALLVTVTDDGRQPVGGTRPDRGGFGLVGMRERSAALGGHLDAGPLDPPAEGWRVQARLPLDAPVREPLR